MFVSKDGTVTGSIDVSKLDEIKPKTDEARAQIDALKAEVKSGQEQSARDAQRLAEQADAAELDGEQKQADEKAPPKKSAPVSGRS